MSQLDSKGPTRREPSRNGQPGKGPLIASAGVHILLILFAWWVQSIEAKPVEFISYEIDLVSPPPAKSTKEAEVEEESRPVVQTPEKKPEDQAPPTPKKKKAQKKEEEVSKKPDSASTKKPEKPKSTDAPKKEESGEDIRVKMQGLKRDYPKYYGNIIRQIKRCFRWTKGGNLEAVIRFDIKRDGTVPSGSIKIVKRSGNAEFDIEAAAAVECAGMNDRLGPLPEDLPYDRLPIEFSFQPQGELPELSP